MGLEHYAPAPRLPVWLDGGIQLLRKDEKWRKEGKEGKDSELL